MVVPLVHMFIPWGLKNTLNRRKAERSEERISIEKGIMASADLLVAPSPGERRKWFPLRADLGKYGIPCGSI